MAPEKEHDMKVMMLIHESEQDFEDRKGSAAQAYWDKWTVYSRAVTEKVVGGNILDGATGAVTVRLREGVRQVQDGPYADSKEALGGYMIFEVETMEEAVELASTCPALETGAVDLRPIVEMS